MIEANSRMQKKVFIGQIIVLILRFDFISEVNVNFNHWRYNFGIVSLMNGKIIH